MSCSVAALVTTSEALAPGPVGLPLQSHCWLSGSPLEKQTGPGEGLGHLGPTLGSATNSLGPSPNLGSHVCSQLMPSSGAVTAIL